MWLERAAKSGRRGVVVGPTKSHRHGRLTVTAATARLCATMSGCGMAPRLHAGCGAGGCSPLRLGWIGRCRRAFWRLGSPM